MSSERARTGHLWRDLCAEPEGTAGAAPRELQCCRVHARSAAGDDEPLFERRDAPGASNSLREKTEPLRAGQCATLGTGRTGRDPAIRREYAQRFMQRAHPAEVGSAQFGRQEMLQIWEPEQMAYRTDLKRGRSFDVLRMVGALVAMLGVCAMLQNWFPYCYAGRRCCPCCSAKASRIDTPHEIVSYLVRQGAHAELRTPDGEKFLFPASMTGQFSALDVAAPVQAPAAGGLMAQLRAAATGIAVLQAVTTTASADVTTAVGFTVPTSDGGYRATSTAGAAECWLKNPRIETGGRGTRRTLFPARQTPFATGSGNPCGRHCCNTCGRYCCSLCGKIVATLSERLPKKSPQPRYYQTPEA